MLPPAPIGPTPFMAICTGTARLEAAIWSRPAASPVACCGHNQAVVAAESAGTRGLSPKSRADRLRDRSRPRRQSAAAAASTFALSDDHAELLRVDAIRVTRGRGPLNRG